MRRKDREQSKEFALDLLNTCDYATLATVNPDGTPYCVPLSMALIGETIYFHCALAGKKTDNIKNNPSVCVSAVRHVSPLPEKFSVLYESVIATGKCEFVTDDDERYAAIIAICDRYAGRSKEETDAMLNKSMRATAIGKIVIDEIAGKANM